MIRFPNAKINLGLNILGKRPDSYHELRMVMLPVGLCDALEIIPSRDSAFHFGTSGLAVEGPPGENLCEQAWHLFNRECPSPPVSMHLYKRIPTGAGLGGGSADAAFTLQMLQQMFCPELSKEKMMHMAAQLGSDCPFFLLNVPCLASGTGTQLRPLELKLSGLYIVIVKPAVSVNTAWAYSQVRSCHETESPELILKRPPVEWRGQLINDFEPLVFAAQPQLAALKESLYALGAVYASMSGSGSALYGIFQQAVSIPDRFFGDAFCWTGPLA